MNEEVKEVDGARSINMSLSEDGTMDINFNGDFKLYEVVGMMGVTVMDLYTNNFVIPALKQLGDKVGSAAKEAQENINPETIKAMEDLTKLMGAFSKMQKDGF